MRSKLQRLIAAGFDLSTWNPREQTHTVRCSRCEATCINGYPCHETGCPNIVKEEEET